MGGFEATAKIRQYESSVKKGKKRTPIIAMTAHAIQGYREKCLEGGMDGYISKPIHMESVRKTLEEFLDKVKLVSEPTPEELMLAELEASSKKPEQQPAKSKDEQETNKDVEWKVSSGTYSQTYSGKMALPESQSGEKEGKKEEKSDEFRPPKTMKASTVAKPYLDTSLLNSVTMAQLQQSPTPPPDMPPLQLFTSAVTSSTILNQLAPNPPPMSEPTGSTVTSQSCQGTATLSTQLVSTATTPAPSVSVSVAAAPTTSASFTTPSSPASISPSLLATTLPTLSNVVSTGSSLNIASLITSTSPAPTEYSDVTTLAPSTASSSPPPSSTAAPSSPLSTAFVTSDTPASPKRDTPSSRTVVPSPTPSTSYPSAPPSTSSASSSSTASSTSRSVKYSLRSRSSSDTTSEKHQKKKRRTEK